MDPLQDDIKYVCEAVSRGEADKESVRRVATRILRQLDEDKSLERPRR